MLLRCKKCGNTYDVSGRQPGEAFKSQCGDIIVVPSRSEAAPERLAEYVERYAKESNVELAKSGEAWMGKFGSARVTVEALPGDELRVRAPFLALPKKGTQAALRRVLELNYASTGGARFALDGGQLFVVWSRNLEGLDYEEFIQGVGSVARTADDFDELLRKEWGFATVEHDTEEYSLPADFLAEDKPE